MIVLKRPHEIEKMKAAGQIVARILDAVEEAVQPGITTWDLEAIADRMVNEAGARAAFKGYRVGRQVFPCCLCISVNHEVVHGIPSPDYVLKEGDIVSVDMGVQKDGYYGDSARTIPVGQVSEQTETLLRVTRESLMKGIAKMTTKHRLEDIGAAVQQHAEAAGFSIVRDFVGHGIGRNLHESPQVPNYGTPGRGRRLKAGMVLAVEPMVNVGTHEVKVLSDGWTVVTRDHQLSAHFEHTVAITDNGPQILTLSQR
jgi:methionyl aminopeptidase